MRVAVLFVALLVAVSTDAFAANWDQPPGGPAATALSSSSISVTWTDINSQEDGYAVERGPSASGPWTAIGTTGANGKTFTATGLGASTRYYFRIRSFKDNGNPNNPTRSYGTYSSVVNALTLAPPTTTSTSSTTSTTRPPSTTSTSTLTSTSSSSSTSTSTTMTVSSTTSTTIASSGPWVRTMAGTSSQSGNASAVDGSGNTYVAGFFMGSTTVDGVALTSSGDADAVVAKYNASGALQWVQHVGGAGYDAFEGVAVDSGGGVVVVGRFSGTVNAGGGLLTSAGGTDVLVVKYAANGTHTWSRRYGGVYEDAAYAVAVDGSGNTFLTGYFAGTIDFGGGPLTVPYTSDLDVFLTKLSVTGTYVWAKNFKGYGSEIGYGVATTSTGEVVLVGSFNSYLDLGLGNLQANDWSTDGFLAKFSSAGVVQWTRQLGGIATDVARGVAIDAVGNIAVTGELRETVDLGGGPLSSTDDDADAFVASYSPTGAHRWSRRMGSVGSNDAGYGVTTDATNNVVVTGQFRGTADFGALLSSRGMADAFVASYQDTNGTLRWVEGWGGADDDRGLGVDVGSSGVLAAGSFKSTATIVGATVSSAGMTDAYLARRNP